MINYFGGNFSSNWQKNIEVAIIGAGPGGLATAQALLKRGLKVQVFERAKKLRPIGAALGLFPNAYKALEAIDPELGSRILGLGVEPSKQILQNSKGDILFEGLPPFFSLKEKYGKPFKWVGWFNLQTVLQEMLPSEVVLLEHCCIGFTQKGDRVSVHF